MKIYFASYLESENCGPGKKYAISFNPPPDNFHVDGLVRYLIPTEEISNNYYQMIYPDDIDSQKKASDYFNKAFLEQLRATFLELVKSAKELGKTEIELLPFQDGDTLLSWERYGNSNYRGTVAKLLKKIGYEVILK